MAQVKIYARAAHLALYRQALSDAIHAAAVQTLGLPEDKRFHRFFSLQDVDFIYPPDRSAAYTILEISMFEGRRAETIRSFLRALQQKVPASAGMHQNDLEITLFETPRAHWGIRGKIGDELQLSYEVTK
ncbi:tautomerase family protein [Deinococcus psychrotolerans]|uniref:Tautomerase family protein n=1 Tax=Deinococcus psychrotolerans TaxID=2489213 RepID=A0A3G8YBD0_9DEIO|nr:tautomerase family protein [Deinococcus psychrotolerans]AZI42223.1 tautomerase family protein [Deinococcus psychrotolerans]